MCSISAYCSCNTKNKSINSKYILIIHHLYVFTIHMYLLHNKMNYVMKQTIWTYNSSFATRTKKDLGPDHLGYSWFQMGAFRYKRFLRKKCGGQLKLNYWFASAEFVGKWKKMEIFELPFDLTLTKCWNSKRFEFYSSQLFSWYFISIENK